MKTNHGIREILKICAICLILLTGSTLGYAQHRDNGRGHKIKESKHNYYRGSGRGNYAHIERGYAHKPAYIRRAPWGYHRPYVLMHNRGRLYYYGGHYYEYYPSRGYLMVEIPVGYEFDAVPPGFRRIWIDNSWCYYRGDLYLRPSVHGFISFRRPGISIGASF